MLREVKWFTQGDSARSVAGPEHTVSIHDEPSLLGVSINKLGSCVKHCQLPSRSYELYVCLGFCDMELTQANMSQT